MIFRSACYVTVFLVLLSSAVIAAENICAIAQKLVVATEIAAKDMYNREMSGRLFSGTGAINDIKGDPKSSYLKFFISCGNDVIITFEAKNAGIMDYRVGQKISLSGKCVSMKKGIYRNTGGRYVLLEFENTSIM